MKDSKIDWIGEIPNDWNIKKIKYLFVRKNEKAKQDNPIVLSLARSGVKIRDISSNEGQLAESYYNYNPVDIEDLLLNPMDLYSGANCSISKVRGVISPAYINLRAKKNVFAQYYDYFFKTQYWSMVLFAHGKGVSYENRWTLGLETLLNYKVPYPPYDTQKAIANYLNLKVSRINNIIEESKKTIEEYKNLKQSLIFETVTGKNIVCKKKKSGIDWLGEIPENWKICQIKRFASLYNGQEVPIEIEQSKDAIEVYGSGGVFKYTSDFLYDGEAVLFGRKGSIGKPLIVNGKFWTVDTMYYSICENNKAYNKFLFYIFLIYPWGIYMTQTALPSIVGNRIFNTFVHLPPLEEQKVIIKYLDNKCSQIDSLISEKEQLINDLEDYKKSLIYDVVTGKKRV